ncbi:hypothetical protein F2Q69_00054573 [Brassica cretica]|uniref:Uncharacterized protein n=2 Tax=Brassica cretica TaxID=69181 RepID=A0A8S9MPK7_BRACR|nr:hypothetical protein F2Q69_00054573 [Brassica cretica]KAF3593263.1 hypothetical protein DY000_02023657 [Brassica cretica]
MDHRRGDLVHTGGITLVTRDMDLWSFSFSEKIRLHSNAEQRLRGAKTFAYRRRAYTAGALCLFMLELNSYSESSIYCVSGELAE